ncbi:hypothetical protein [Camelliibacillus cellulosilyticus]|uniref:hypothetical protein n=1 Tax=Camelliibacillus cellulosilyticus TaxID=2174486 RepID=UPI00366CF39C
MLSELTQKNYDRFIANLKANNGDIFKAFIDSYQFIIKEHRKHEHQDFFKNTFSNMNYKLEKTLAYHVYEENQRKQYLAMIQLINTDQLNVKDDQDLHHILKIIMAITFHNLVQVFAKDLPDEKAFNDYTQEIELLKKGLCKETHD